MTEVAFVIGAILNYAEEPIHGYLIADIARSEFGAEISDGTLYRTLKHMARDGLVTRTRIANHRQRTYEYGITAAGRTAVEEEYWRLKTIIDKAWIWGAGG